MTKCHFGLYGGSGTLQKFDALCVLGMNIINEKVAGFSFWIFTRERSPGLCCSLVLVHALGRHHRCLHCVQVFSFFFTFLETMPFRIVPVCVPSVRKWGAYNMKTIIDKFDFKFANRVKLFPTQCNATNLFREAAVRRGRELKRCSEGELSKLNLAQIIVTRFLAGWPSLTGWWWSTWESAWTRTTSPTWSTWWQTTSMMSMSMRRRWETERKLSSRHFNFSGE